MDWLLDKVVHFEPMVAVETAEALAWLHEDVVIGNEDPAKPHRLVRHHERAFKDKYDYLQSHKDTDLFASVPWHVYG